MNISTWILIISLVLGILCIFIRSFISADDESKQPVRDGLLYYAILPSFGVGILTGVFKFMTRNKGVPPPTNATANANANATPSVKNRINAILSEKK
jgi:hypothetical protein